MTSIYTHKVDKYDKKHFFGGYKRLETFPRKSEVDTLVNPKFEDRQPSLWICSLGCSNRRNYGPVALVAVKVEALG